MSRKRGAALGIHGVHGGPPLPGEVARDHQVALERHTHKRGAALGIHGVHGGHPLSMLMSSSGE